jgi:hypothetical protein
MSFAHVWRSFSVVALIASQSQSGAHATAVSGMGTWETTLQARDLDGNKANGPEAYYDTALNITWLADANFAQTSGYAFYLNGNMNGDQANIWTSRVNISGISGWRMPASTDVGNDGCTGFSYGGGANTDCGFNVDPSLSEMAHMFYVTLGMKSYYTPGTGAANQPGFDQINTGPFNNIRFDRPYWSSHYYYNFYYEERWRFQFVGRQDTAQVNEIGFAWPVHAGDVGVAMSVPEPESWVLALAGFGIAGLATRRKA